MLGGGDDNEDEEDDDDDDDEKVNEVKDDGEEEEEEEEDEDEMIQRRRRRRSRGGQRRRRKMRDEKTEGASEGDDDKEGVVDRGRGRRRRANRRRGRGGRRMNNKRARQERDADEDEEEEEVGDENEGAKTTVESVPSSRPTNRKDREEQQKRVRAKLDGVPIDELDARAHRLMIKYTVNSKEEKNENNDGDDSNDSSSVNEYYAALSSKGISPLIVSQMIKSVKADWAHKSVNPDIDNVLGMAHLFIHFELLTMAGEMFGDIVQLYRDSGLIVPAANSPVSHPWRADTLAQDRDISPLSRAFIGQSL